MSGGILSSQAFGKTAATSLSDSASRRIFSKPANPNVSGTLRVTVDKINALPHAPEFTIHTGDISHTAKASEFDSLEGILKRANQKQVFYVPGEHDIAVDDAKQYLERFGKGSGFEYSGALKSSHLTWDADTLNRWLADPNNWSSVTTWRSA